jgi:hypothetical protein
MANLLPVAEVFTNVSDMERFATAAVKSGIYKDIKDVASAMVRIQVGRELGLGAAASLKAIQLIMGTPTFSANFVAALIKKARPGYNYRIKELTPTACSVDFYEDREVVGNHSFTMEDAKRAGLDKKDIWVKYPKSMLFARCITAGARVYCPDLTAFPFYTTEELGGAISNEDILDEESPAEKTFSGTSDVSIEDRYKLVQQCGDKGIKINKLCSHLGIISIDSITEVEFRKALQFVNSSKGV